MTPATLSTLFTRDLNKLKEELSAYQDEATIWHIDRNIANSAGNLALHMIGNLNAFIGAQLGGSGYIRDRVYEFEGKGVNRTDLIRQIDETIAIISSTLPKLSAEDLTATYPLVVFKEPMTTEYFLTHLATHLSYHLGQVNYHRRLLG